MDWHLAFTLNIFFDDLLFVPRSKSVRNAQSAQIETSTVLLPVLKELEYPKQMNKAPKRLLFAPSSKSLQSAQKQDKWLPPCNNKRN